MTQVLCMYVMTALLGVLVGFLIERARTVTDSFAYL